MWVGGGSCRVGGGGEPDGPRERLALLLRLVGTNGLLEGATANVLGDKMQLQGRSGGRGEQSGPTTRTRRV